MNSKLASVLALCNEVLSPANLNISCAEVTEAPFNWLTKLEMLMPVTLPRSPAAHPPLFLSVPMKVALVEYSLKVTTCPSRTVKVSQVSLAVTLNDLFHLLLLL